MQSLKPSGQGGKLERFKNMRRNKDTKFVAGWFIFSCLVLLCVGVFSWFGSNCTCMKYRTSLFFGKHEYVPYYGFVGVVVLLTTVQLFILTIYTFLFAYCSAFWHLCHRL